MLLKNIIGIIIITLNAAGIIFLIYTSVTYFLSTRRQYKSKTLRSGGNQQRTPSAKKEKFTEMILEKEDDLLQDMDLSDLDDLDLDDFE